MDSSSDVPGEAFRREANQILGAREQLAAVGRFFEGIDGGGALSSLLAA